MTTPPSGHFIGVDPSGRHIYSRGARHLLVCGPSQAGKTTSVLAHAVRSTPGATLTTSTKEDLLLLPPRNDRPTLVLDLLGRTAVPSHAKAVRFSPLTLISTFEDALLLGRTMMDAAYSFSRSGVSNEAYWTQRAARLVAALLWAASRSGVPIGEVFGWAAAQDSAEPIDLLSPSEDIEATRILEGLGRSSAAGRSSNQASTAVWSFAEQAVALYAYPTARALAAEPNLDPEEFVRGDNALHVVCPSLWAAELGPAIAVLIQALVEAKYRQIAAAGRVGVGDVMPLTLVLDEVANTAPLPSLPALCSEGAGQGVLVILGTQDRAQLEERWGPEKARTIVSNCRDRLILGELGDRPFLDDIEALSGTRYREDLSVGNSESGQGPSSTKSITYHEMPAWRSWEIAQLPEYRALYLKGWTPQLIRLKRWDDENR